MSANDKLTVEELETLLSKISPKKWQKSSLAQGCGYTIHNGSYYLCDCSPPSREGCAPEYEANSDLIAIAPEIVKQLTDTMRENERFRGYIKSGIDLAYKEGLEDCMNWCIEAREYLDYPNKDSDHE